jgi:urease accessory protein
MSQTTLLRLMTLLSPSFPVGGFAYSHGLEQASADGLVTNAEELGEWLSQLLRSGTAWNDAVLLAQAHRGADNPEALRAVADLAEALAGSQERHMESQNLGAAFITAVKAAVLAMPDALGERAAYPVAVGAAAAAQGLAVIDAVSAFLHAFVSNQIQCAIRLGILGQNGGVALLTGLEPLLGETAARASQSTLDDLGVNSIMADIAAMRHETLYSRIFRT